MEDSLLFELVNQHCQAVNEGDIEGAVDDFENGSNVSISFRGKRYQGISKIHDFYEQLLTKYNECNLKLMEVKPEVVGDMGVIKANCSFKGQDANNGSMHFSGRVEITCSIDEDKVFLHSINLF